MPSEALVEAVVERRRGEHRLTDAGIVRGVEEALACCRSATVSSWLVGAVHRRGGRSAGGAVAARRIGKDRVAAEGVVERPDEPGHHRAAADVEERCRRRGRRCPRAALGVGVEARDRRDRTGRRRVGRRDPSLAERPGVPGDHAEEDTVEVAVALVSFTFPSVGPPTVSDATRDPHPLDAFELVVRRRPGRGRRRSAGSAPAAGCRRDEHRGGEGELGERRLQGIGGRHELETVPVTQTRLPTAAAAGGAPE